MSVPLQRQDQTGPGVLQNVRQTLTRVVHVQWHVRAARFQDAQHGHQHFQRALHPDGNHLLGPDATLHQVVRQPVGSLVQFAEGQRVLPVHHCVSVRPGSGRLLEQSVEGSFQVDIQRFLIPGEQNLPTFLLVQQAHPGQRLVRALGEALQHPFQVPKQSAGRLRIQTIRVVRDLQAELVPRQRRHQRDGVVALFERTNVENLHAAPTSAGRVAHRVVLEDNDRVEQRQLPRQPGPPLDLHQWGVLHLLGAHELALQLFHQVRCGQAGIHTRPHRQRVDEKPHHLLHALEFRRAPGNRGAE